MSISSQWLYNGLQKEKQKIMLIDCRDYEEYEKGHIATAVCMPPELGLNEDGEEDFVDLTELNTSYFKHPKHFQHYETREQKYLIVYNDNDHNMWIGHVISCMDVEGIVKNVQALEEGFLEFKEKYSFLTTTDADPQSIHSVDGFPYPVEIDYSSLYLSVSKDSDIHPLHIKNLSISALLYVGEKPNICDSSCEMFEIGKQLDDISGELSASFIKKMEELESQGKKVLLHTPDQQQLLSLAVVYLFTKKKTLREAYNFVIQSFWKDGVTLDVTHIKWLAQEEKRILGSNSVTENEINSAEIVEEPAANYCSLS